MAKVMTASQLVEKAKDVAANYKTLYVLGAFGCPLTPAMKSNILNYWLYDYNRGSARRAKIKAANSDPFAFDCIGVIKGLAWGWAGVKNATYGGAKYEAGGVNDYGADMTISICEGVSTNFSTIIPGECVWMSGHIGIYIGDGLCVESSPAWKDGVQVTAVLNIGAKSGYNGRRWTKHGRLPYIDYTAAQPLKTVEEVAQEVLRGLWGSGAERKQRLTAAGYDYNEVQACVNKLIEEAKLASMGDIDMDGKVTAADARLALRAAVGLETLTDEQKRRADMDGDGKITAGDGRTILRKATGAE